jgi:hypothetical protein
MANLTDNERQLIEAYGRARRGNGAGTSFAAEATALADRLRVHLPDLDDTTIAKVVLFLGLEMLSPDETDGRFAGIAVTMVYTASVLGETGLIDPSEA